MSAINDLGFVPIDEIQNVFITEMQKIELDIKKNGVPLDKKIFIEWVDSIRLRLMQRSKHNIESYIRQHPQVKEELRKAKEEAVSQDSRKTWQERVEKNRTRALLNQES